jgi:methyltransferase
MFALLLGVLLGERAAELLVAERNRRWALARGAEESGAEHYPLIVALHTLFYVALVVEHALRPPGWTWNRFWPVWAGLLVAAQVLRVWALASLGRFWNTRILVIPGAPRVARGPYRHVRHPNYVVVAVEIAAVSLLCRAYVTAIVFSILNALVLRLRIRAEERALERLSGPGPSPLPRFLPRPWARGRLGAPRPRP